MRKDACPAHDNDAFGPAVRGGLNVLLVCRDPAWTRAVHDAVDSRSINVCDARGALTRLAGVTPNYSHLLLQPHSDDGLFDALFQMTSETAGSDTELLMLGGIPTRRAGLNIIHSATPRLVQEALMDGPRFRRSQDAPVSLTEIKTALDGGMISARYQPIVRLSDRQPVALEVLARMDHPDQGTVMPDRFIPQIEDAGLAARLTELITERALTELADFLRHGLSLGMTLNFPLDVIMQPAAIDRLEAQRRAAGMPAGLISIELTESMPVQNFPALRTVLERIRGLGYRAAIDDVSPTVPGLTELLALPFTGLKLDKDIVAQAATDPTTLAFLRSTTERAHQAGMIVVAEGIETIEAWRLIRSAGIDGAQGYLLARPLPAAAVPVWIDNWARNPTVD